MQKDGREPGDKGGRRKQQREMLCWCRSWVELGCGNSQVQKQVGKGRGKLQHTYMHMHSVVQESCRLQERLLATL